MKALPLLILVSILFAGCQSKTTVLVPYSSLEPLRVLILPFAQIDKEEKLTSENGELLIDEVPLLSSKLENTPGELLRQYVTEELTHSPLEIISPFLVNLELPHHGFSFPDESINFEKLYRTPAKELCNHFLDCDAVLYGHVTEWERNYYGIESVLNVGLKLKLVGAKNEAVLYEAIAKKSDRSGLTGGPTGLSDLLIEPLKGLDSEKLSRVAEKVAVSATRGLSYHSELERSPAPIILAASHTPNHLSSKSPSPLLVLAYGTAGCQALFSVGAPAKWIPMIEVEPGQYVGEYHPFSDEVISKAPVRVELKSKIGRSTMSKSAGGEFWLGEL